MTSQAAGHAGACSILGLALCWGAAPALAAQFDCVIEPSQVLELRSPIEGLIERVNVDRGDFVKKGQELAVLDTAVDRAAAAIAKQRSQMEGAVRSGESGASLSVFGRTVCRAGCRRCKTSLPSSTARGRAPTRGRWTAPTPPTAART